MPTGTLEALITPPCPGAVGVQGLSLAQPKEPVNSPHGDVQGGQDLPSFGKSARRIHRLRHAVVPMPAFSRLSAHGAGHGASTAARPPVPMPSLSTATSLPPPSANTQALSPQKAPFRALYWENLGHVGRGVAHLQSAGLPGVADTGRENTLPQAALTPRVNTAWLHLPLPLPGDFRLHRHAAEAVQAAAHLKGSMPLSTRISSPGRRPPSKLWYWENSPAISSKMSAVVWKCPSTTSRIWAARSSAASL